MISQALSTQSKNKSSAPSPTAISLTTKILTEEVALTAEQRDARYVAAVTHTELGIDNPHDHPYAAPNEGVLLPRLAASYARSHLIPLETRFLNEARTHWPSLLWRRYAMITIQAITGHPSVWFAPFLCTKKKLIIVLENRDDMPYRVYGQNRALYERHGYTVLDFSEDFSVPWNQSVWNEAMAMVDAAVTQRKPA